MIIKKLTITITKMILITQNITGTWYLVLVLEGEVLVLETKVLVLVLILETMYLSPCQRPF